MTDRWRERYDSLLALMQAHVPTIRDALLDPKPENREKARQAASAIEVAAWDAQQIETKEMVNAYQKAKAAGLKKYGWAIWVFLSAQKKIKNIYFHTLTAMHFR